MSNKARMSQTRFNPHGGVDLDMIAERLDEHDADVEAAGLDFNDDDMPPDRRDIGRRAPKAVTRFA
jgi:hypothetical protein